MKQVNASPHLGFCLWAMLLCLAGSIGLAQASTVFTVEGFDARGSFKGQAEITATNNGYQFVRVINYEDAVRVEDGRTLAWVWMGKAVATPGGGWTFSANLQRADFIKHRGPLTRTQADQTPTAISGTLALDHGVLKGQFQGLDVATSETWSMPAVSTTAPIFEASIAQTPTHNALQSSTRNALFSLYASFQALPDVAPYADLSLFKNPIHTAIRDTTDYDFYQQHPKALRVINKVIDPISLQETLVRADAYKWSLADKAAFFDHVTADKGMDSASGLLFEWINHQGIGTASDDAALWTGAYALSQYYRFLVTRDETALTTIAKTATGLLKLLEITGDSRTFARSLRKAEGHPTPPWIAGTGEFSGLEWEQGGNNDMFKGILLGLTVAQASLCDGTVSYGEICARIKRDMSRAVTELSLAQGSSYNRLGALWLTAYSTGSALALSETKKEWNRQSNALLSGSNVTYNNGIADWSGSHLAVIQYLNFKLLSEKYPLQGIDTDTPLKRGIENIYQSFARVPMGLWSVAFSALGTMPHANAKDDALWRLREMPAPKTEVDIDQRISQAFVMSPFPSAPWKMDWSSQDRTQSLNAMPLFKGSAYRGYAWKENIFGYKANNVGGELPGADYLIAYWLGRSLGVIKDSD